MRRIIFFVAAVWSLSMACQASAGAPMTVVKSGVDEVLATLRPASGQPAPSESARKDKIRSVADSLFDYEALAYFTLGGKWSKLNAVQQKEFTDLYRRLLEQVYMAKILGYTDEQVDFEKETMLPNHRAEVSASIVTSSGKIPMVYRMLEKNGQWRVYDVVIEGISIVRNYRAQFHDILTKNTPQQMIEILRKKVDSP